LKKGSGYISLFKKRSACRTLKCNLTPFSTD
jgi:hypothetical protein